MSRRRFVLLLTALLGLQSSDSTWAQIPSEAPDLDALRQAYETRLRERADAGDVEAQFSLGERYDLLPEGTTKAIEWFAKAANQGHVEAQFRLGVIYENGDGVPKDIHEAIKWYSGAAERGHVIAQLKLGRIHQFGWLSDDSVSENMEVAIKWYTEAAEQGNADAQFGLAFIYHMGHGVTKDTTKAIAWLIKAAEKGHVPAQTSLAAIYHQGDGVPKNDAEAIKWYTKAAEQDVADAQCYLGFAYALGEGVRKDNAEAIKWFIKAAGQGIADAQFGLGVIYSDNDPRNPREAIKWFTRAAEQGHAEAQFNLSGMYMRGEGVPQNHVMAYHWTNLAAAHGMAEATQRREALIGVMTRDQVAEAQRLSAAFKPKVWRDVPGEVVDPNGDEASGVVFGSGFFVSADGYFITNHHVVARASRVQVRTTTGVHPAAIVRQDSANDLALLKVQGDFSALHVRGSTGVRAADGVATVGYPNPELQGLAAKFASGEIAAVTGPGDDPRVFQISVPIQPGNSGGPLVDVSGSVIGVVVAQLDKIRTLNLTGSLPENVNYAIKGTILLGMLESVPGLADKLIPPPTTAPADMAIVAQQVEAATGMVIVEY